MQYMRCKCGNVEAWTSGESPKACHVCKECGSTLAYSPDSHLDPEPHEWEVRYDSRTGKPSYRLCVRCYERAPLADGVPGTGKDQS